MAGSTSNPSAGGALATPARDPGAATRSRPSAPPQGSTGADGPTQAGEAPGRVHFPCFEGLRALAALGVVLVHVAFLSGMAVRYPDVRGPLLARGEIGVSVFFVISGFLLYRPFVAANIGGGTWMTPGQFFKRRVLRIIPAYWVVLTIVGFGMKAPGFDGWRSVIEHYLLIHVYDLGEITNGPVQQAWSLCTEIGFYAFLPLYVWAIAALARRSRRPIRVEVVGVSVLIGSSILLKVALFVGGLDRTRYGQFGTWLPFRLDEFGVGMALAIASAVTVQRGTKARFGLERRFAPVVCWGMAAVVYWVAAIPVGLPMVPSFTAGQALTSQLLYTLFAALVVLPAVFGPQDRGVVRRFLQNPVMVWLGLISYGIYIWHEAFLTPDVAFRGHRFFVAPFWRVLVLDLAATIAVSAATYYIVERPFLRLKNRRLLPERRTRLRAHA